MWHSHADDISDQIVRWCLFHVAWNRQRVTSSVTTIFFVTLLPVKVTNYNRSFLTISIVIADTPHIHHKGDGFTEV